MNKELINKTIDVMNKVEIGSLIRLDDILNFRVVHREPSWHEINHFNTPSDHVIRLVNETIKDALNWTKSASIRKLRIKMVQQAVEGLFEDIELVEEA